jgi:hypothetical protein
MLPTHGCMSDFFYNPGNFSTRDLRLRMTHLGELGRCNCETDGISRHA